EAGPGGPGAAPTVQALGRDRRGERRARAPGDGAAAPADRAIRARARANRAAGDRAGTRGAAGRRRRVCDSPRAEPRGVRCRRARTATPRPRPPARRALRHLRRRRAAAQDAPDRGEGAALGSPSGAARRGRRYHRLGRPPAPRRRGPRDGANPARARAGARSSGAAGPPPVEQEARSPMSSLLVVVFALLVAAPAWAQQRPPAAEPRPAPAKTDPRSVLRAMEDAFSAVADRVTPAVVHVSTTPKKGPGGAPEDNPERFRGFFRDEF